MSESPEQQLEQRASEFVQLLAAHEKRLGGFILSLVPNWSDADDLAQETKLRLWKQFDEYDRSRNFYAWAQTIAYYLVLGYRKTKQRDVARFSMQFMELVSQQFPSVAYEHDQRRDALAQCLGKLKAREQQLLAECYSGNRTIKEVAIAYGRSIRGTQESVARIRMLLQECIERVLSREDRP